MASTPLHSDALEIHIIPNWKPADATALAAITPDGAGDEGKFAWQLDTDEVYMLTDYTGPTWVLVGGGVGVQGPGSSTDNTLVRFNGTGGDVIQGSGIVLDDNDDLQMADNKVVRPELQDYGITQYVQASVSGAAVIDLENGNSQKITVTGNITSMDIQNWPASGIDGSLTLRVIQGGTGSYTIVWDTGIVWPGGTPPTISTSVGSLDVYVFKSDDAGTTIIGAQVGANFS